MKPAERERALEQVVLRVLTEYRDYLNGSDGIPVQLIADRAAKHYQLTMMGWQGKCRHFLVLAHLRLENGKVYLEHNATEEDFIAGLEALGVQKSEVVVAFQPPYMRPLTGYALE